MPGDAEHAGGGESPRRAAGDLRPDRVYLGFEYALVHPEAGPQPRRPTPPDYERLSPAWLQAQRRDESQLDLPLALLAGTMVVIAALVVVLGGVGRLDLVVMAIAIALCLLLAGFAGYGIWQGERALGVRVEEEKTRLEGLRAERDRRLFAAQEEHARDVERWRARKVAYETQLHWYAVSLPRDVHRIDVAGGTPSGWSALVTTLGATLMDAGGELTVVDLSEQAVAADLARQARDSGRDVLVLSLPDDLPGRALDPDALDAAATPLPTAQLRVAAVTRRGEVPGDGALGTYVAAALAHELRLAGSRAPWEHALVVCGAERLRGDALDRLFDACEATRTGLVVMYRSIPQPVRERLGRGGSAVAFMRLEDPADAKAASECLGGGHRVVLSRLTEAVGAAVGEAATTGGSYPHTGAGAASAEDETLIERASTNSSWGRATVEVSHPQDKPAADSQGSRAAHPQGSRATDSRESPTRTIRGSRELIVDQRELRHLPASALILCHDSPAGRRVVLADANPGILALPRVTMRGLEEAGADPMNDYVPSPAAPPPAATHPWDPTIVPPNLGPPPDRLDWRR